MTNTEKSYYMFQDSEYKHLLRDIANMLRLVEYLAKKGFITFQND